jgi:hypothetical protein
VNIVGERPAGKYVRSSAFSTRETTISSPRPSHRISGVLISILRFATGEKPA